MPFAASLSTHPAANLALEEACAGVIEQLPGRPDLMLVFFSPHHARHARTISAELLRRLEPRCLLGCIGEAIVGGGREVENEPALSLWAACWPGTAEVEPFHLSLEPTPEGPTLLGLPDSLLDGTPAGAIMLLLGDPFTPVEGLLHRLNTGNQGLRVFGGMASGVRQPGDTRLLLNDRVESSGLCGVVLAGLPGVRGIVSQGCRPIGTHMVVTRGRQNIIEELGGRPPLERLRELWPELPARDQQLVQQGLHLGMVANEYQERFGRGDFLVRNVLGVDRETGALVITDRVRVGQTVQFQVRDAQSADEDLRLLLRQDRSEHAPPAAALLFTCNGRGTRLFNEPDHDVKALEEESGRLPAAGFFAQGELGPIGGQNFIHGFTASLLLLE